MADPSGSREVPWCSIKDWSTVKNLLYSFEDLEKMKRGIELVATWKCRVRPGTIPVSVEMTATLVSAYIASISLQDLNHECASLNIAMAIVRFVNGVTDQLQTGLYAQSVQEIADQIDIPNWLVDLRHQATHSQLPSYEMLQAGLMIGLSWLDRNYWNQISKKTEERFESHHALIEKYIDEYAAVVSSMKNELQGSNVGNKKEKEILSKYHEVAENLAKCTNHGTLKYVTSMLHLKYRTIIIKDKRHMYLAETSDFHAEPLNDLLLLVEPWQPLFKVMAHYFPQFVYLLLDDLSNLLKSSNTNWDDYILSFMFLYKFAPQCNKDIIQLLLNYPCSFWLKLLRVIINEMDSSLQWIDDIDSFIKVFEPISSCLNSSSPLKTNIQCLSVYFSKAVKMIRKSSSVDRQTIKNYDQWTLLSHKETNALPPMGSFQLPYDFSTLDLFAKPEHIPINAPTDENATKYGLEGADFPMNYRDVQGLQEFDTDKSLKEDSNDEVSIDFIITETTHPSFLGTKVTFF